jgi:hypothetical protein
MKPSYAEFAKEIWGVAAYIAGQTFNEPKTDEAKLASLQMAIKIQELHQENIRLERQWPNREIGEN